ncbi:hypothetical protein AMS68_007802 [Peltaster fructicola]|uniref:Apple domain-containing protein n=1 Tax=Peltaster fructicola TaxID=286661 RepID=A0A6H0Y5W3_9PEZI|nr:hypothetical protein AMS68_007802 [Peltaster fructicola]
MHILLTFLSLAAAASAGTSAFTESLCLTIEGTKSLASVPTATSGNTKTYTVTARSTTSKTSTVTPLPVTTTTTIYTTKTSTVTAPINTDTFSSTTTLFTTSTSTVVVSAGSTTVTSTSTSTQQDTTTVAPSTGYTPIWSQITSEYFTTWTAHPAKRHAIAVDRPVVAVREPVANPATTSHRSATPSLYPSKVTCFDFVQILTTSTSVITATKTATTTLKPVTSTISSTSTIRTTTTTTKTSASTTIVSTVTSSISTTTTFSSTYTSTVIESTTVVGPTVTSYAVCNGANNYLHKIQGVPIYYELNNGNPPYMVDHNITDEVSCCNACQLAGDSVCAISSFTESRGCILIGQEDGTCKPNVAPYTFVTGYGDAYTVMNGNCGHWEYDYNDSEGPSICGPGTPTECSCGPGTNVDCQ